MPLPSERVKKVDPEPGQNHDGVRLGINIFDIDRIDSVMREMMRLTEKIDRTPIRFDPSRMDEGGVAFSCSLLDAACLCDVIRSHDRRAGDFPTRVYVFRKAWSKLPSHAVLTRVREDGKCVLNPEWFGEREIVVSAPPERRRYEL
jgi:hypothetical protein